jgi:soluble lytic murein transglycosylase-like protein
LLLLIFSAVARAEETALPVEASPAACFRQAAERHNIPVELLIAVAEAESGLSPFAMNRGGSAILPRDREEAERILTRIGAERTTFDVGIMQVNRWWFEKYGEPYRKGLDVCFNVDFGARILAMAIKDHGFTWEAVGSYHSPTGWRKAAYAQRIFGRLSRILEKRKEMPLEDLLERKLGRTGMLALRANDQAESATR